MKSQLKPRPIIVSVCMFLLTGLPAAVFAQSNYDRVFIFGDSLSDSGNIYVLTGETSKAPYALVPSYPYAQGGHHFSNGKTWAERLAQDLQKNVGGKASLDKPGVNGNYAHGGARARANSGSQAPSSAQQVSMFLNDFGAAPSDALYIVQFGGNDLRDALIAGLSDPSAVGPILQSAVGELAGSIQSLYLAGARHFLVANAPNIGYAPAVTMLGAGPVAGYLTSMHNVGLEGALWQLENGLPGISVRRLDLGGFIEEVVTHPADFGFTNVVEPCLNFLAEQNAKCENPEMYFFWDGLHPTSAGHQALAVRALEALSGS
jgi:outer membrane lipase/esterase